MTCALSFKNVSLVYGEHHARKASVKKHAAGEHHAAKVGEHHGKEAAVSPNASSNDVKNGICAVQNLNLEIEQGESIAVIGPSGCGKSSTLQMAAGLVFPTSGSVEVQGSVIEKPRKDTALILQDFGLLPWKNVYANAELGLSLRKVPADVAHEKTLHALEAVGLQNFANSYPNTLSGGMKQRLALARSLALDAKLLLMDEPLSALDALLREQMQDLLLKLWQCENYTQVLVTHSIEEAVFLGQRIFVMSARPGTVLEVLENPQVGTSDWRENPLFFERVQTLRHLLRQGCSSQETSCLLNVAAAHTETGASHTEGGANHADLATDHADIATNHANPDPTHIGGGSENA